MLVLLFRFLRVLVTSVFLFFTALAFSFLFNGVSFRGVLVKIWECCLFETRWNFFSVQGTGDKISTGTFLLGTLGSGSFLDVLGSVIIVESSAFTDELAENVVPLFGRFS